MIDIESLYKDVALDNVNSAENSNLSYTMFNRLSKRAELRMLDYLSGDVENLKPPAPYNSQKVKDWLSPFIKKFPVQVTGGFIEKPADYYGFENIYALGGVITPVECDEEAEAVISGCNTIVELLDNSKFYTRCTTFIDGLQPSFTKPVCKMVGNRIEFLPSDLGSVTLEYVRYPLYGYIVTKIDTVYNDEVVDTQFSRNYEWPEFAREMLCFFITDTFSIHTREKALKEHNAVTQKLVRG